MPAASTAIAAPGAAQLLEEIASLLSKPPHVDGIALDTTYYAGANDTATRSGGIRVLLPGDYTWRSPGTGSRVPLQLCEFLAYKTALAYESEKRIEAYLAQCCGGIGISDFKFFNSARNAENTPGVAADAQGYGFIFERRAYIIFRGTASKNDWKINRIDALTSELDSNTDRRYRGLQRRYGHLLGKLGDPKPGRHVGFSIAWAALKDEVEDWLAKALEARTIDQIVYSGHSLGGAMAQVAAFDHARIDVGEVDRGIKPNHIAAVVTFGAPAVGGPEFVKEYARLLDDRTVLLESSGDLVPRIMQRWYYRMLYPLRQRIKAGVQAHLSDNGAFSKVVSPWSFASEPPLSNSDIDSAIANIRSAAARVLKDAAEREKKTAEEEKKKADERAAKAEAAKRSGTAEPGVTQTSTDKSKDPSATKAVGASGETSTLPKSDAAPNVVYWVVVGVFVIAAAGIAWYFVRRKLFSHDIEQRYALYLSTLSYQQLRAKHGGNIEAANRELEQHLAFVRGNFSAAAAIAKEHANEDGKHPPLFESVQNLPLPITIRKDPEFIEYLRLKETFV